MEKKNEILCTFCSKYDCNCEESQALNWLMEQNFPSMFSAYDVAKALVRYRVEKSGEDK